MLKFVIESFMADRVPFMIALVEVVVIASIYWIFFK